MKQNYYHIKKVTTGWTKIPNAIRHDSNLTSDAKVVIEELLSVSGKYHISETGIANSVHISLDRVKKAIRLLRNTGYIQIIKVKDGSRFGGYEWRISDVGGTFREMENQAFGNQAFENPSVGNSLSRNTERLETERPKTLPIYEYTNNEYTNNKEQIDKRRMDERQKDEADTTLLTPLTQSEESIISSGELNISQAFDHFCEVYPRLGSKESARDAFFAIPDISNICWQIANSVEWFEKMKRWDDWQTGQKNKYCPGAVKFLKEGHWQEFLKTNSTMSFRERMELVLSKAEENEYGII